MTATTLNPTERPAGRAVKITRVIDAPRALVFEAWTKKAHLDKWCAPHGFTIPWSEGEVRPGGAWKSIMRSPDGVEYHLSGVYREVVKDELLVFTQVWEDDSRETTATVRFADHGENTKLSFEEGPFESVESRDSHQGGWTECMERLDGYLKHLAADRMTA